MFLQLILLEPFGLATFSHEENGFRPSRAILGFNPDSSPSHFLVCCEGLPLMTSMPNGGREEKRGI